MSPRAPERSGRRRRLLVAAGGAWLWPSAAHASDMTILMFFVSFPVCVGLVAATFLLAAVIRPAAAGVLVVPIALLVGIHVYLLPHMVHTDEQIALAIQALVSGSSLLAFRVVNRRKRRLEENAAPGGGP